MGGGRFGRRGWVLTLALVLAGCLSRGVQPDRVELQPGYAFALGVSWTDVSAMLGEPSEGPFFDRLSQTNHAVYSYPFPAIQAETHFPNGITRSEMVEAVHLFFDRSGLLVQMTARPDPNYPSVVTAPVHRITVLPRAVRRTGLGPIVGPVPVPTQAPWLGSGAPSAPDTAHGDR
jgi:hypothetical protein